MLQDVIAVTDKILKKLDVIVTDSSGHESQDVLACRRRLASNVNRFEKLVEKKKQVYENVYNFFFNAVDVRNIYIMLCRQLECLSLKDW